jgi:uncharacterized membrane protein YgcG
LKQTHGDKAMSLRRLSPIVLLVLVSLGALAQDERILSYDSDIHVYDDGSMVVKESIRVYAAGNQIKHGIYRDFPTEYKDKLGIRKRVPFDIINITRDGKVEDYHTGSRSNGVRVYIGPRFSNVPVGEHTYVISYRTDRQLGFYSDKDELYWNVTGNGWSFPIDHASALVRLPERIPRRIIETYAYTGPVGYQGRDFTAKLNPEGTYYFETNKSLAPYEGMTIVCWWDKGYMQPPSSEQERSWFFEDNQGLVFAVLGLAIVLIYQSFTWAKVGKDPQPGTIVPLYMPPTEVTAAGMREMVKMRFDNRAFAACVVSMAAKKYLTIEKDALDAFTLVQTKDKKAEGLLSTEEKLVAQRLFSSRDRVLLTRANREPITEAVKALRQALDKSMEKIYFVRNGKYLIPSAALSVLTLLAAIWYSGSEMKPVAAFMLVWLTGWSVGVIALMLQVINLWKAVLKGGSGTALKAGGALFMTLFALPFVAGEVFGIFTLSNATSVLTVMVFGALIASNFVFHELLKAPTRLGRELLDKIEGFKLFLAATEGDQIQRVAPVNWNADTFNRYLPYAIALDVEEAWTSKFSKAMTSATAAAASSAAYSGALAGAAIGSGFASSLGDSLSGAISSASVSPGSSSGSGGGGSSGGGGGGGGGGGW